MDKKWFRKIFTRRIFVIVLLLMQIALLIYLISSSSKASRIASICFQAISVIAALYIMSRPEKRPYKLTWVFILLSVPFFGGLFYIFSHYQGIPKATRLKAVRDKEALKKVIMLPGNAVEGFAADFPEKIAQARYLSDYCGFPVLNGSEAEYLSPGERFHERVLEELKKAEKYIFIESFIIQQGVMWDSVLAILEEKAAAGVDVRLMYDDMGCFLKLPSGYNRFIESKGIKCVVFNPFRPFLSASQNNRDHRKIVSIDGRVAFTGGNNFADEYINAVYRFGYWKDSSVVVTGKAAWSLTVIFLELWSSYQEQDEDFALLYPWRDESCAVGGEGYLIPYADSPLDREHISAKVFLQMISGARDYLYINTPYLIIDDILIEALTQSAKGGVDVRIVTPGIADKPLVHAMTRCYYHELLESGVKIYEYSPGFMHSKTVVSDDRTGVVGTINFDYRSLYLHFECGVLLFGCGAISEVKADFLDALEQCRQIKAEACEKKFLGRLFQQVLRLFAPLL